MKEADFTTPDFAGLFRKNAAQILGPLGPTPERPGDLRSSKGAAASGCWKTSSPIRGRCTWHRLLHADEATGGGTRRQRPTQPGEVWPESSVSPGIVASGVEPVAGSSHVRHRLHRRRPLGAGGGARHVPGLADREAGGIVAFDDWTHPRFRTFLRLVAALWGEVPHEVLVENEQLLVRKAPNARSTSRVEAPENWLTLARTRRIPNGGAQYRSECFGHLCPTISGTI
jgi:hypothetical protein